MNRKSLRESIALAVKMETDGIDFYSRAQERVKSPMAKMMFRSFVADERSHLSIMNDILGELFHRDMAHLLKGDPVSRVKTVFEENRAYLNERLAAEPDDLDGLEIAMRMEDEGYLLYRKLEKMAVDPDQKLLYGRLAAEEQQHFRMLQNSHTFLTDTGNWFIYEEHALMDGG